VFLSSADCVAQTHLVLPTLWCHLIDTRSPLGLKQQYDSICSLCVCKAAGYSNKTNTPEAMWVKWSQVLNPVQRRAVVWSQLSGALYQPCLPSFAPTHFKCRRLLQLFLNDVFPVAQESLWLTPICCPLPSPVNGTVCHGRALNQWPDCFKSVCRSESWRQTVSWYVLLYEDYVLFPVPHKVSLFTAKIDSLNIMAQCSAHLRVYKFWQLLAN